MALFRRKKKVVKPTSKEQRTITTRLKRKYPQMYATPMTKGQKKQYLQLSKGDRPGYLRMIGTKMKKEYKGK